MCNVRDEFKKQETGVRDPTEHLGYKQKINGFMAGLAELKWRQTLEQSQLFICMDQ